MNPSFSRILTRTRFAPNALGQAPHPTDHDSLTCAGYLISCWVGYVDCAVIFMDGFLRQHLEAIAVTADRDDLVVTQFLTKVMHVHFDRLAPDCFATLIKPLL